MSNDDPISTTGKAIEEVARTTGKAIDAGAKFGGFVAKYIDGPLEQAIGIWEDKLKYTRWERQLRLMQRADQTMRELNLAGPTRQIPLKLAVPLLQGASMEDDDYLQDQWVSLLVNAANRDSGVDLHRSYIDILEHLSPIEAQILHVIYSHPAVIESLNVTVLTRHLPDSISIATLDDQRSSIPPSEQVQLALANLSAMGCIQVERSMNGKELFGLVLPRYLGRKFVEACTLKRRRKSTAPE